jgi:YD repeat-containing protein
VYTDEGHLLGSTTATNNFLLYTWIQFMKTYLLN